MKNNPFQTIALVVMVFIIIIAVTMFALTQSSSKNAMPALTVWGIIPAQSINDLAQKIKNTNGTDVKINYVEKNKNTFDKDVVEALASNAGPDLMILPDDMILRFKDKIYTLPYASFPERQFKDTYVQEGELFLNKDGVMALPFMIDPLVMYWNRDIFNTAGIAVPPKVWSEFFLLAPKLTRRDNASNILRSALAFGEFRNVTHAKDILSALIIQSGNPIVAKDALGQVKSTLNSGNGAFGTAEAGFRFFTEFSNPIKDVYSWNRSLPQSKEYFISGDLGVYIGYASEFSEIQGKNGNLNFDVAVLPQAANSPTRITFGKISGLAVLKNSAHISDAFKLAYILSSSSSLALWNSITHLPPVRRDLLVLRPTDALSPVFYDSAISARGWQDPDSKTTDILFQRVVENSLSGKSDLTTEVKNASDELQNLLEK